MSVSSILLAVLAVLILYCIVTYNHLIALKNRFSNAFAQIDVQLQRRYELIPNLVGIANRYLKHEQETLTAVIQARNQASDACSRAAANPQNTGLMDTLAQAESALGSAMGKFNLVMEDYPELKADESMRDLHEELTSTENRVGYARQAFNDAVMKYNTATEQFPAVLVANMCSFKPAELLQAPSEAARQPVKVSFA